MTDITLARPDDAAEELRDRTCGAVHVPGDASYEAAAQAWNLTYSHRPVAIVEAADVVDVVETVRFAAEHGLGLGVQATGHGVARPTDGVLLLTHRLDAVSVDPTSRTARVGAGATWAPVLEASQVHGLAPLLGSTPHVGAVGYTLGGGVGWLARKFGTSADSVRSFEVVTPDGRLVKASADEHPELYRSLRGGGGGSLGVVTSMEIDLHPVTTVYGGNLLYPAEQAREVITAYAEWVAGAPDDLTSEIVLMNFPPLDDVPEPLRGRSFAIVRGCWSGPLAEGRALIDGWRALMPPAIDLWAELPFTEVASISNDPVDPLPASVTGAWLDRLDGDVADALIERTFPADGPPVLLFSEVRHLGGAITRADRDRAVLGHRDKDFLFHAVALTPTPEVFGLVAEIYADLRAALAPAMSGGVYLNFVEGEERRERTRDAFDGDDAERVADLKRELDPDDVLRFGVAHT